MWPDCDLVNVIESVTVNFHGCKTCLTLKLTGFGTPFVKHGQAGHTV